MNRRRFLTFLGIAAPIAAVVAVAPLPRVADETFDAADAIRNWKSHPYHHTVTLPEDTMFRAMAERREFPIHTEMKRSFFQYDLGSKS